MSSENPGQSQHALVMALEHYDRHLPFFDGSVAIEGAEVTPLAVGQSASAQHGAHRHERMLQRQEFDIAEVSLSSYLMAKDRGAPFTAVPVFPRRLFSQSQIWVNKAGRIRSPQDLAGRRVGIKAFQITMSVLAKADLTRSYGVPWRSVEWVTAEPEVVAFSPPPDVRWEQRSPETRLDDLLVQGDIDALIVPHPSRVLLEHPAIGRLFTDPRPEEAAYVKAWGYYPIMHLVVFRDPVLEARPELAPAAMAAFDRAWELCQRRWQDPNWSWLAWGRLNFEEERQRLGSAIWANGLAANRANLEWFIAQSLDQGLIRQARPVEEWFHPSTWNT